MQFHKIHQRFDHFKSCSLNFNNVILECDVSNAVVNQIAASMLLTIYSESETQQKKKTDKRYHHGVLLVMFDLWLTIKSKESLINQVYTALRKSKCSFWITIYTETKTHQKKKKKELFQI